MTTTKIEGSVKYKTINEDNEGNVKTLAIWTIPDFMKFAEDKTIKELESPEGKFQFKMYFDSTTNQHWISFKSPTKKIFLKSVELKTLIFDENEWELKEATSIARDKRKIVPANRWYLLSALFIDGTKGLCSQTTKMIVCLLKNDTLCLHFEFVTTNIKTKMDIWNIPTTQLNDIFKNVFVEGTYSDIVMKSTDGHEFKVHKVLLAGQSAVLKAHFDHNFTESVTNIVETPLECAVLHEMLSFMYTDQAKVDEMPEKLLAAADYYQLSRLKSLCEKALYRKLNVDNAVEILQLADLHSTELLTELTLDFIRQDYDQRQLITKTEGWAELNSIDLMKRIFK